MIISASYRTDIPAFYADWFMNRLAEGRCRVTNPYGGPATEVALTREAVDGFVFWTRNIRPFRGALSELAARGTPFVVHSSITGYPRALETSVARPEPAVAALRDLAARYGPRVPVWRYDPILITSLTPPDWHRRNFARLAAALAGTVDEVVVSFAQIYAKTRSNTARAARRHGFTWADPPDAEKRSLLAELAGLAAVSGMRPTLCAQSALLVPVLAPARCIDGDRLAAVAGAPIAAKTPDKTKRNRPDCLCAESRDIGAYDSCPHGCVYCYAVRRPDLAKRRHRDHDPRAPFLIDPGPRRRAPATLYTKSR